MEPNISSDGIPATQQQRRTWIKYQLALRGLTLSTLAARRGLSSKTVQKALRSPYPKMEALIAGALRLKPQQLWPERFTVDGKRLRPRGWPAKARAAARCPPRRAEARS